MDQLIIYIPAVIALVVAVIVVRRFGVDRFSLLGAVVCDLLFLTKNLTSGFSLTGALVSFVCDFVLFYLVVFLFRYLIVLRFRD